MTDLLNPNAVIGDNLPDYAKTAADEAARQHAALAKTVTDLLAEARELPPQIDDDAMAGVYGTLIKRLRDTVNQIESHHATMKEPYLRGGQGIDSFFFGLWERIAKRSKTAKPGALDILQARVTDYINRKIEAERLKRQREADEAAERERVAQAAAAKAAAEAEERRLAAERARAPQQIETKEAAATAAEVKADSARVDALMATDAADAAHLATKAKSADLARTRVEDAGVLLTARQEPYAEIVDATKLDKEKLWPFISVEAKEKALRAWARNGGHKEPMDGATIGHRNKGSVR